MPCVTGEGVNPTFGGHRVKVTLQKAEPGTHEDTSAAQKQLAGLSTAVCREPGSTRDGLTSYEAPEGL